MLPQAEPFCSGATTRFVRLPHRFCYVKGIGSWGDGPGVGVPASAGVWPKPADAGTPGALSGGSGHPACRVTDAHHLFRQSLTLNPYNRQPGDGRHCIPNTSFSRRQSLIPTPDRPAESAPGRETGVTSRRCWNSPAHRRSLVCCNPRRSAASAECDSRGATAPGPPAPGHPRPDGFPSNAFPLSATPYRTAAKNGSAVAAADNHTRYWWQSGRARQRCWPADRADPSGATL